jgi:hypothetical protein
MQLTKPQIERKVKYAIDLAAKVRKKYAIHRATK